MFSFFLAGWRAWKNAPGPALLAIAALALGIGSTTAIYTVIDAALLKPLPYANPDRYFAVLGAWRAHPKWWTIFSYADGKDYTAAAHTVDALGYYGTGSRNLVLNRQPVHVTGTAISAALLKSFGVAPAIGRLFEDATANPNEVKGALISTSLWRRFGSPPDVVGKPLTMNGMHYTITGVMPGWFRFPIEYADIDVWSPLESADNDLTTRGDHYLRCIAKLKPGVTPAQTTAELNRVLFRLQREYPGQGEPDFITLTPLLDITVDQIRPSLLLLLAAAGALFLITCANVASLLLARSASRSRETAIRVALGATSRQLAVQYFSEGLLVALVGAAIGVVLSIGLVRVVLSIAADEIPRADQVGVNWQALLCVLILAVACATFCSLAPLWRARQIAPNAVLSEGTRASAGTRSKNLLRVFVVAEIALAFGLLALGGAILRQVNGLSHLHPGFEANNLTVASMFAPDARYTTDEQRANYQGRLLEKIRHLPGISDAGFITLMPLTGWAITPL